MKHSTLTLITCAAFGAACATVAPTELSNARAAYARARTGPAARLSPVELHAAAVALEAAEHAFDDSGVSYRTRDLAYVAQRKSELAEASASIAIEVQAQANAKHELRDAQGALVDQTKADLTRTRDELKSAEQSRADNAERLAEEQRARAAAEQRTAVAVAALAKLAAVKDEPRGLVITLSGSVLFASNNATLLPNAQIKLNQVAEVLLTTSERHVTVEGHTDSQGSEAHNLDLSKRRADAVRDYLVSQHYEADMIVAEGFGETRPITGNDTAEGRANNRRVEIVVAREATSSSR